MPSARTYPRLIAPRLREALRDTPAVLVHGPRQSGKTTLARSVGEAQGYRYVSFDDDATRMADTDGYTIKGTKDSAHRAQSVAALEWLRTLHGAVGGDRLIATPYADPDVMALAGRHMSTDVKAATQEGDRALATANFGGATSVAALPPDGLADQATLSALVASGTRTKFVAKSPSSASVRFGLERLSCMIGTSVALNRIMNGGEMPGGMLCVTPCDAAVICAIPASTFASGWKYTLITLSPASDCDSTCSMSFT